MESHSHGGTGQCGDNGSRMRDSSPHWVERVRAASLGGIISGGTELFPLLCTSRRRDDVDVEAVKCAGDCGSSLKAFSYSMVASARALEVNGSSWASYINMSDGVSAVQPVIILAASLSLISTERKVDLLAMVPHDPAA